MKTSVALGEQQQSAVEIYVTDPVFDEDEDRPPVTLEGSRLFFDTDDREIVASRLTEVLNGVDDEAEDKSAFPETRKQARQARDALTSLVRKIRKGGSAGGKRRHAKRKRVVSASTARHLRAVNRMLRGR
jgi:hypothetical protein